MNYSIDIKKIEHDIYQLAQIGYNEEDKGIYRPGFSQADMEARKWLTHRLKELNMTPRMDGAGNIIGRYGDDTKSAILVGSHIDSVPSGGIFDGSLGVIAGMECIRVIQEQNIKLNHAIEIIGTSEEEGRFGGMLGAQALTGNLTLDWLENACTPSGELLTDAMQACGLDYREAMHAKKQKSDMAAFIELHIEQGPVLEAENKSIGVVEGISGVFKWLVKLIGKADHAGTAPMDLRSDAFMGMADFAHELRRIIDEEGTDKTRLTIGHVQLKPGYAHTVPGEADFTLVGRDMSEEVMNNIAEACNKVLGSIARKHRLKFEYNQMSWLEPKYCSESVISTIEEVTQSLDYTYIKMPSGAGHDAQFFSDVTPTGMIFIPSIGGVSHAPDEWSHWEDIEKGTNVLLNSILELDKKL